MIFIVNYSYHELGRVSCAVIEKLLLPSGALCWALKRLPQSLHADESAQIY